MQIEQNFTLPVGKQKAWETMMDIPLVATCMPGVESFDQVDPSTFAGLMKVRVGPISLNFAAAAKIEERDDDAYTAKMVVEGSDKKVGGSVRGTMSLAVEEISPTESRVITVTDVNVLGKIGQFGFSVMKKKADSMLGDFAKCIASKV